MDYEFLKIMLTLLSVASVLIGPSVWYLRFNSNKNDEKNKELIKSIQEKHDKSLERIEKTQSDSIVSIKSDLKEFRTHLDTRFSEVYNTVDAKMREIREQLVKEMDYLKKHIGSLEQRVESQNEKSHQIEKQILMLENVLSKEYITKEQLEMILQLNKSKN